MSDEEIDSIVEKIVKAEKLKFLHIKEIGGTKTPQLFIEAEYFGEKCGFWSPFKEWFPHLVILTLGLVLLSGLLHVPGCWWANCSTEQTNESIAFTNKVESASGATVS